MAQISYLSPPQLSPSRRPLQNICTNANLTPQRLASTKMGNISPIKQGTPLTPTILLSNKKPERRTTDFQALNPPKKRAIDEVIAEEREQVRASFSSLINYDPPSSDGANAPVPMAIAPEISHAKARTDVLKLRLQMAMFRVRTNQIETPLAQLVLPSPSPSLDLPVPSIEDETIDDNNPPFTPPQQPRPISRASTIEDLPLPDQRAHLGRENANIRGFDTNDLTSSVVKGAAISGLLGLRKMT